MKCAYYNEYIRCYEDGRIESQHSKNGRPMKNGEWRELKPTPDITDGYVRLGIEGKTEKWHRVIWVAFNGEIPNGLEINHKDTIRHNNSLNNLELLTHGDNNRYSQLNKRKECKPIIRIDINTGEEKSYPSFHEVERDGFDRRRVRACCDGKRGCKTHKGYYWKEI